MLITAALVGVVGGLGWATADHPPEIDGKNLALEIEVRVPRKSRTIDDLKAHDFTVALVISASDRNYSDMRWSEARAENDFIIVPAWSALNSRNAGREITAGVDGENRQIFNVILPASPKKADGTWSDWTGARQRFDGSKTSAARSVSGALSRAVCERVFADSLLHTAAGNLDGTRRC